MLVKRFFIELKRFFNFVFVAFPRKPGRPRDYAYLNRTKEGFDSDL